MESAQSILTKLRRPSSVWGDALVLLLLFAGINFLLEPLRPGWFSVNPNPYLLIPVLMGGRYGSSAGLYSAAAVTLMLCGFAWYADPILDVELFLRGQSVLFFFIFLFGLCSGEVQAFFRRKAAKMELLLEHSSEKMRVLDRDIRNIARVNRELQERLLVSDNRTFAMDLEIRALYECRPEELWKKALLVLNRTEDIACAALYTPAKEDKIVRKAMVGGDPRLAEVIELSASPLVREALVRGEMMILPDLLASGASEKEPFLFAKPLETENSGRIGVLVVSRMPFFKFDPTSLARIDLTVNWISEILDLRAVEEKEEHQVIGGAENKKLLTQSHFQKMVSLSVSAWQELRVPSGIISIRGPKEISPENLLEKVNRRVRTGDFICRIDNGKPNVTVLLPFTSERGTGIFVDSCRKMLEESLPDFKIVIEPLEAELFDSMKLVWAEIERKSNEDLI